MLINTELFSALGFSWNEKVTFPESPKLSPERVCYNYKRMLAEFVWDASYLEGNPYTYPEVKTLLEGITIGGHKLSDQEQILCLAESAKKLIASVATNKFHFNKQTFCDHNKIIAIHEALDAGNFRGEAEEKNYTPQVALGIHGRYTPLPTIDGAPALNKTFTQAVNQLETDVSNKLQRGILFSLHGALFQYFFDGNKRTSRTMMNGILMSSGYDALSIPASKAQEYNEKMVQFYLTRDATQMLDFMKKLVPTITIKR